MRGRVVAPAHGEGAGHARDSLATTALGVSPTVPALVAVDEGVHGRLAHLAGGGVAALAAAQDRLHLVLKGAAGLVYGQRRDEPRRLGLAEPDEVGEASANGDQVAPQRRSHVGALLVEQTDAVAAALFGAQQGGVGRAEHAVAVRGRLGEGGDADGHGHVQAPSTGMAATRPRMRSATARASDSSVRGRIMTNSSPP